MMVTVNDLMTVIPSSVAPDTPMRTVIGVMKTEGCRQLPVLENGKLIGIISDRDVRLVMNSPVVLHGRWQDEELLDTVTAESCMTPNPITVAPNTPAYRAAEMLSIYKFGALPVLENDTLVGIITVTDFLEYAARALTEDVIPG
ncbi:MAG: CBS domain-containing protein [Ardenticatenaceae bacterium]|nr:CBS domain-containing protein [Anaerolineales bacterium]MCB8975425.1 CBS domain-containing protein [Ardenticatenaceae bacterium]